jgi:hypothetical protein
MGRSQGCLRQRTVEVRRVEYCNPADVDDPNEELPYMMKGSTAVLPGEPGNTKMKHDKEESREEECQGEF